MSNETKNITRADFPEVISTCLTFLRIEFESRGYKLENLVERDGRAYHDPLLDKPIDLDYFSKAVTKLGGQVEEHILSAAAQVYNEIWMKNLSTMLYRYWYSKDHDLEKHRSKFSRILKKNYLRFYTPNKSALIGLFLPDEISCERLIVEEFYKGFLDDDDSDFSKMLELYYQTYPSAKKFPNLFFELKLFCPRFKRICDSTYMKAHYYQTMPRYKEIFIPNYKKKFMIEVFLESSWNEQIDKFENNKLLKEFISNNELEYYTHSFSWLFATLFLLGFPISILIVYGIMHGFSNLINFENIYGYLLLSVFPISWFMTFAKHSKLLRFDEDYYEEFINLYRSQEKERASFIRKKIRNLKRQKGKLKEAKKIES